MPKSMFEGMYRKSDSEYISRLEAAYLAAKKDSLEWDALDEEEIDQKAYESLERIKAGGQR